MRSRRSVCVQQIVVNMASQEDDNKPDSKSVVQFDGNVNFINVYKKFEYVLNNKNETFPKKIQALIEIWKEVGELNRENSDIRYMVQVMDWAKLHTLNIILTGKWKTFKGEYEARLLHEVEKTRKELLKLSEVMSKRCQKLADVIKNPWEDPILSNLLHNGNARIGEKEIEFFCSETAYLVSFRLKKLCESQCEDLALNLVTAYMNCYHLSQTNNFNLNATKSQILFCFDIQVALLFRYQKLSEIVALFKRLPLDEGLSLIRRFTKKRIRISKVWRHYPDITFLGSQVFVTAAVTKPFSESGAIFKELLDVWISFSIENSMNNKLETSLRRIILEATESKHIYVCCEVVHEKMGMELKPFIIEMYVRALTTDMNNLESQRSEENDSAKVATITESLAKGFANLADILKEKIQVSRECTLTSFSLEPTLERLRKIEDLARASGFNVLDTGQYWECKMHPPVTEKDDLCMICNSCGKWMCKPNLDLRLTTNFALNEALDFKALGIPSQLCDDLAVVLNGPRYHLLSWLLRWEDLHRLCTMYLNDMEHTKNLVKELKFLDIDFSQFITIKREPVDEMAGIERGYERFLYTDLNNKLSFEEEHEFPEPPELPQAKSNPDTLKTLRMFRPNLKRNKIFQEGQQHSTDSNNSGQFPLYRALPPSQMLPSSDVMPQSHFLSSKLNAERDHMSHYQSPNNESSNYAWFCNNGARQSFKGAYQPSNRQTVANNDLAMHYNATTSYNNQVNRPPNCNVLSNPVRLSYGKESNHTNGYHAEHNVQPTKLLDTFEIFQKSLAMTNHNRQQKRSSSSHRDHTFRIDYKGDLCLQNFSNVTTQNGISNNIGDRNSVTKPALPKEAHSSNRHPMTSSLSSNYPNGNNSSIPIDFRKYNGTMTPSSEAVNLKRPAETVSSIPEKRTKSMKDVPEKHQRLLEMLLSKNEHSRVPDKPKPVQLGEDTHAKLSDITVQNENSSQNANCRSPIKQPPIISNTHKKINIISCTTIVPPNTTSAHKNRESSVGTQNTQRKCEEKQFSIRIRSTATSNSDETLTDANPNNSADSVVPNGEREYQDVQMRNLEEELSRCAAIFRADPEFAKKPTVFYDYVDDPAFGVQEAEVSKDSIDGGLCAAEPEVSQTAEPEVSRNIEGNNELNIKSKACESEEKNDGFRGEHIVSKNVDMEVVCVNSNGNVKTAMLSTEATKSMEVVEADAAETGIVAAAEIKIVEAKGAEVRIVEAGVVEAAKTEVIGAAETDVVEAAETDVVEAAATEIVEAAATEIVEAAATEVVEAAATEVVEAAATEVVEAAATEVVEAAATEVVEAAATEVVDAAAMEVVETAETEVVETAEAEVVKAAETGVVEAAEVRNVDAEVLISKEEPAKTGSIGPPKKSKDVEGDSGYSDGTDDMFAVTLPEPFWKTKTAKHISDKIDIKMKGIQPIIVPLDSGHEKTVLEFRSKSPAKNYVAHTKYSDDDEDIFKYDKATPKPASKKELKIIVRRLSTEVIKRFIPSYKECECGSQKDDTSPCQVCNFEPSCEDVLSHGNDYQMKEPPKTVVDKTVMTNDKRKSKKTVFNKKSKMVTKYRFGRKMLEFEENTKNNPIGRSPPFLNPRVILERLDSNYVMSVLSNVPGLNDYEMIQPGNVNHIVNVVQVSGGRAGSNVPNVQGSTQTSTQITPHIQRVGQPRSPPSSATTQTTSPATTTKPVTTQPSTLINILSQQIIRPGQSNCVRNRTSPLINILSQQIIRPATPQVNKTAVPTNSVQPTEPQTNSSTKVEQSTSEAAAAVKTSVSKNVAGSQGQGTILQFICKSTLPKFQQAFGKTVYQNNSETSDASSTSTDTSTDAKKTASSGTKTAPVNIQPIQGGVIYTRQMPVGQTINLIPPGRGQVFRIATSNSDQISLVSKDTVIHSKMSALLAAALQGKQKSSEGQSDGEGAGGDEGTRVTVTRPTLVQSARIVKPSVLQIPSNVIRSSPQSSNMSSTTLEQLREFDMVYKQIKERSSTSTPSEQNSQADSNEPSSQRISVTYLNQGGQKYTQLSPVVVVSSYCNLQPAASPALSVTSQGSSSPCVTPAPTPSVPKVSSKGSKGKTVKSTTTQASKASPIPKPQQKPQEDEHTTQRIFDILAEYAEQLRNSPDLNNKPAPRRRSNPPTNPSQNSKRKKSSGSKKSGQSSSMVSEADIEDQHTVGSEDSSCGVVQISVQEEEQQPQIQTITSESNDSTSNASSRQQLILTDAGNNQTRNLIIADSSVGEALKMPNTAVLVPGNYIMPVSMVKGGQQIAVVSGGSKILATVPARSGPNMLLFQSFLNQNRKSGGVPTVKYSTIQPISGISSQSLAGVSGQPPVILPSNSHNLTAVALGQPLTLKKLEKSDNRATELLLTISQPRDGGGGGGDGNTQTESTTSSENSNTISSTVGNIELEETIIHADNTTEKVFHTYQKSIVTAPIATPVIAQTIKEEEQEEEETPTSNSVSLAITPENCKNEASKTMERVQSVLVTACTSNGPMLSHTPPRYRKPSEMASTNNDSNAKEEFLHNGEKQNNNEQKHHFQGNVPYFQNKVRKPPQKLDKEMHQLCLQRKQAALERELRLQKSLSEECEDLGVDEPSTSDLFPEADILFDSNHSPSFDQSSQDLVKRPTQPQEMKEAENKTTTSMTLFSDDDNSSSLRTDFLFESVEYHHQETTSVELQQLTNGQSSASSGSSCEDGTLLQNCASMSDVTLNSPDGFRGGESTPPPLNKYKFKYSNRRKGSERHKPTVETWTAEAEVSSSEDTMGSAELIKSPETCGKTGGEVHHTCGGDRDEELNNDGYKIVAVTIAHSKGDDESCGEEHCDDVDLDSPSGRGARRSVKKTCSCCNGDQESGGGGVGGGSGGDIGVGGGGNEGDAGGTARKRPTSRPHTPAPHKKAFLKKR